jgi:DNA-binding NtrC family response regulator
MPLGIQAKILRLLQERSIERLGGRETIPVDVRIIAATNRDLETAMSEGRFREDLYYRLKVVTINLPPLSARQDDILLLTNYFLARYTNEMGINNPGLTKEAENILKSYPWPGNIRELTNTIQKALIFNRGAPLSAEDMTQAIVGRGTAGGGGPKDKGDQILKDWIKAALTASYQKNIFDVCVDHFSSLLISEALNLSGGNRSEAARLLGVSRPTLHAKIEKYGLKLETSVKNPD